MFLNIWPIIDDFIHLFPLYTFGFFNSLNIILAVNFFFLLEWGENFTQGVLLQSANEKFWKVGIVDFYFFFSELLRCLA